MPGESAVRAVVAFPHLDPIDKQWIEATRGKHDPQAKLIAAHFTLVFPAVFPARTTEAHVAKVAESTEPIRFALRRAAVVSDPLGTGGHVFLIPEEGRDGIAVLHDRLYEGALQSLRRNASFTPHITVAARPTLEPLEALAREVNTHGLNIRGSISEIALVEVTPSAIRPVVQFQLGATGR